MGGAKIFIFPLPYLGCIPVVTIGASVTAGMYCMSKMHDPESMIITVEYFHAFAVNFKKATLVWILFLFIGFIGAGDLFYAVRVADGGNLFFFLFFAPRYPSTARMIKIKFTNFNTME